MASEFSPSTSVNGYSELIADGKSFPLGQVAHGFVVLKDSGAVPTGPAELIIRYQGQPEIHRHVAIIGHDPANSGRINIRRT